MKKLFIVVFILIFSTTFTQAEEYHFVSIEKLIEQEVGRLVIPKIYEKLNIKVTITPMPGKRAQHAATSGKKDGEIMRIWTYGENNPTTIRVPTPYYYLETMAFIKKDSGINIGSKDDLKNYKLVKVRGVKHTNNITKGLSNVDDKDNTAQMMKLVDSGRSQVALTNTVDGNLVLKQLNLTSIKPIDKPLAVLDLYHYIHESHKDLVPKVDAVIKEMKASGELAKVIKEAEAKVIGM
ncbi:MAG: transporter substrate-binding domain-containing protein [Desulfobacterales bacterium]|nr:transporter substrate-binding domain-containing protein [Desulfobacterales bacterium]